MKLMLYNSMTRKKEPFVPINPQHVKMYVCGPTVYDYIHIGNARPLIFFDVVRRYLTQIGYTVNYVVNFTDVDDKLIRKAEETGRSVMEVADQFIEAYFSAARALGIEDATEHPRVTDHMPEIIQFIKGLVDKGYAYAADGDVYFRTKKFAAYGQLSHQNIAELQHGIRVEVNERKENAEDFVLWKKAKPGEISWESPWGDGRPGWHIECSALNKKFLGETIDIHGGGQDLQFPHHECEAAQSEALHGAPLAKYWMHNGYIHIDNEKMSKSLGNGVLVKQLIQQVKPELLRFFMLSTHYRNPLNFSMESLQESGHALERIENSIANLRHRLRAANEQQTNGDQQTPAAASVNASSELAAQLNAIREQFHHKMQDDFNTADAITALFDLVGVTNHYLQQEQVLHADLQALDKAFQELDAVLGILPEQQAELLDEEIEQLIEERKQARESKNWARADEIRDLLKEQGIVLEDTAQGMRWRRK